MPWTRNRGVLDLLRQSPAIQSDADLSGPRALAAASCWILGERLEDLAAAEELDPDDESAVKARPAFDRLQAALPAIAGASATLAGKPDDTAASVSRAYWYLSTDFASGPALEDAEAARRIDPNAVAARTFCRGPQTNSAACRPRRRSIKSASMYPNLFPRSTCWIASIARCRASQNCEDVAAHLARGEACEQAQQFQLALQDAVKCARHRAGQCLCSRADDLCTRETGPV